MGATHVADFVVVGAEYVTVGVECVAADARRLEEGEEHSKEPSQ